MTPQIPGYLLSLESILRPLVMTIALGLIWLGAARIRRPRSRVIRLRSVLSAAVFLVWEAVMAPISARQIPISQP